MYVPRIRDDQVKSLYQLKVKTEIPMTRLIQEAVDQFLEWASLQDSDTLKDYLKGVYDKMEPMTFLQEYEQLRTKLKDCDPSFERLLHNYELRIENLEKANRYLRGKQEELVEFSKDWLDFEQASDDIKWFAVKVLKELGD